MHPDIIKIAVLASILAIGGIIFALWNKNSRKHKIFLLVAIIFFATRIVTIFTFPIDNDEGIYLQYAQFINTDFKQFKYISMNNVYGDWKPPLQYWLGSLTIRWGDPLMFGRFVSVLASLIGFVALYVFVLKLFGKKEAIVSAVLYLVGPGLILYQMQFRAEPFVIAETFVLLASIMLLIKEKNAKKQLACGAVSAAAGAALLLTKQSGIVYLIGSVILFLTLFRFNKKQEKEEYQKHGKTTKIAICVSTLIAASILYSVIIPKDIREKGEKFNSQITMSLSQMLKFPGDIWSRNAEKIGNTLVHYYTFPAIAAILVYMGIAIKKKEEKDLSLIALMIIMPLGIILGMRQGLNEYHSQAALGTFIPLALARIVSITGNPLQEKQNQIKIGKGLLMMLCAWAATAWLIQSATFLYSPQKYLEKATEETKSAYLTNWTTGYGIKEVVDILKNQEDSRTLALIDPQWGNPATALLVFQEYYYPLVMTQNLTLFWLSEKGAKMVDNMNLKKLYFIFSNRPDDDPTRFWQPNIKNALCAKKQEIKKHKDQIPILVCELSGGSQQ